MYDGGMKKKLCCAVFREWNDDLRKNTEGPKMHCTKRATHVIIPTARTKVKLAYFCSWHAANIRVDMQPEGNHRFREGKKIYTIKRIKPT